jgi:hypothetical protein
MFKSIKSINVPTLVAAAGIAMVMGGGGAYAAAQVSGSQVVDNSLTGTDIKDGTVFFKDLSEGTKQTILEQCTAASKSAGFKCDSIKKVTTDNGTLQLTDGKGKTYTFQDTKGMTDAETSALAEDLAGLATKAELQALTDAEDAREDMVGMTTEEKAEYLKAEDLPADQDLSEYAKTADEDAREDKVGINESRAGAGYTKYAAPGYSVQFAKCPAGKVAISGGYRLNGHASEAFSGSDQNAMPEGLSVVATEPAGVVDGQLVNTYQHPDFPQTAGGSFEANAWAVTFLNEGDEPLGVRIWATCVNAS